MKQITVSIGRPRILINFRLDSSGKQRRQKSAVSGMRVDITTDLTNGKMIKEYYESAYANKFDKLQELTKNEQSTEDNYLKYNCNLKTVKASIYMKRNKPIFKKKKRVTDKLTLLRVFLQHSRIKVE